MLLGVLSLDLLICCSEQNDTLLVGGHSIKKDTHMATEDNWKKSKNKKQQEHKNTTFRFHFGVGFPSFIFGLSLFWGLRTSTEVAWYRKYILAKTVETEQYVVFL